MTGGHGRNERGVAIVLVAISMVALMAIAALVIDAARLRTDRRVNKKMADLAAIAGVYGLKQSPWKGACDAYRYLLANSEEFTSFGTESWTKGDGTEVSTSAGGGCSLSSGETPPCTEDNRTWARFRGTSRDGRTEVNILGGYHMPDPSFAAEDDPLAADIGALCDQIAVIVRESRPPSFSGVIGFGDGSTRIRSVARIIRGTADVAALIVLERHKCRAIDASANSVTGEVGKIDVLSKGARPGIIHVDSDGAGCQGGSQRVVEGSRLPAGGGANVIARATAAPNPPRPGEIHIVASRVAPGVDHTDPTCAAPADVGNCTISPTPTGAGILGRTSLDERYVTGVKSLQSAAAAAFDSPPGTRFDDCTPSGLVENGDTNVHVRCNPLRIGPGTTLRFTGDRATIVVTGRIEVAPDGRLELVNPKDLFVLGESGQNKKGVAVGGTLTINGNGFPTCAARGDSTTSNGIENGSPAEVTRFVVAEGAFDTGAQGTVRMCQTTLLMAAGGLFGGASVPLDNDYQGWVNIGGQGSLDWTAPNRRRGPTNLPTQADWNDLEDLALWTEAARGSTIAGAGAATLQGVFALPNSGKGNDTFTIGGQGSQNISADAQFWVRRLRLGGKALLTLSPNPEDSIPTRGVALVR